MVTGYLAAGSARNGQTAQPYTISLPEFIVEEHSETFVFFVNGDSQAPCGIRNNDLVVISPKAELRVGDL